MTHSTIAFLAGILFAPFPWLFAWSVLDALSERVTRDRAAGEGLARLKPGEAVTAWWDADGGGM